ncbi:MAG: exodeoxyribonuclease VII small subunit, partial [Acidobacteria bacterium]|nr:exodeoxyribonuclease VII small subunit [Acidobacteriota bacterium]
KSLEDGDLALEESLRLFEEGVALTRLCAARLEEAQKRIDLLTRNDQGLPKLVPFDPPGRDEEGGPEAP